MKKNDDLRIALHYALVDLDSAQSEIMKLVCIGIPFDSDEWLSALDTHAERYNKLQAVLSQANTRKPNKNQKNSCPLRF
ncbi:hypothetical protein P0D91_03630 [Pseudomonas sp. CBSPBW29]|jgi:hypothetical protein|uniref:hypothetical protein n=1 Tax=Pseudomonas sp. CBS TaxID=2971912 RepID=UPI0021AC8E2E|nr:hypothetical protein [Pseudomonas sp. CBS]WEL43448.1 hypothetical protein P0D91_03630 [Pseudomonas sp. CBSPBW29]WEL64510.1 hypothetical protein P0D93_31185 [Pseudomonas sp. CBSPGW29]WEL67987.1 hypothetical protein P0D94_17100 [Pseudomonas sp. CBSPCGW29]WEL75006.1 hypothetical protein P0D92_23140 [Pseudomonas sp. CBSPAW29]WEL80747.1 hypothetical protein P0D95_22640 [Pseudomonas sp. CBSPCAW29]WEL89268.1 hypothetical protein P0D90_04960 [Pseudomonas sp. CBSPCBW29]